MTADSTRSEQEADERCRPKDGGRKTETDDQRYLRWRFPRWREQARCESDKAAGPYRGRGPLPAKGAGDADYLRSKIFTARFFADHVMAQASALAAAATRGAQSVLDVEEALL